MPPQTDLIAEAWPTIGKAGVGDAVGGPREGEELGDIGKAAVGEVVGEIPKEPLQDKDTVTLIHVRVNLHLVSIWIDSQSSSKGCKIY